MFTGLCYGKGLAKITNYENWHTKLIQRCLKVEKYMTSSMTAIKTFQFYFFVYFYLFCLFFVVLYFFFYQLQSWHMSLVWYIRRIWPPLPHISHNAVGKDLPYIFNKIPSSCLCSRYREFSYKPALFSIL